MVGSEWDVGTKCDAGGNDAVAREGRRDTVETRVSKCLIWTFHPPRAAKLAWFVGPVDMVFPLGSMTGILFNENSVQQGGQRKRLELPLKPELHMAQRRSILGRLSPEGGADLPEGLGAGAGAGAGDLEDCMAASCFVRVSHCSLMAF